MFLKVDLKESSINLVLCYIIHIMHHYSNIITTTTTTTSMTTKKQIWEEILFCKSYFGIIEKGTHLNTIINRKAWTTIHHYSTTTTYFRWFQNTREIIFAFILIAVIVKFKFMNVTWRFILIHLIIVHCNNSS